MFQRLIETPSPGNQNSELIFLSKMYNAHLHLCLLALFCLDRKYLVTFET